MKLYKVLDNYQSCTAGTFDWSDYLPHDDKPGDWTPVVDNPAICERGYHGTDAKHILGFINGNQLWEVEALNPLWETGENANKFTSRSMRLVRQVEAYNDKTLRLFACWCVRQVWSLLTDERSRVAVEVAERYANGEASKDELDAARAAAWDAARDAAWATAWDAAWAAAWADAWEAQSKHLAEMLGLEVEP